ncbi:4-coumarate-CoA ligase [Trichophyton equinum CBS 127.97]|uniref:4-coumarate-CoA ligase n=1 Tax=Trichophyton equinum (strain ATCC MYA-4606 / CBS 127.97) TaxID=559882 RepID=F2PN57_TRIEC|nr:4-coumarate-CoA ligase [Trichophyton equinum CBS 127.97]
MVCGDTQCITTYRHFWITNGDVINDQMQLYRCGPPRHPLFHRLWCQRFAVGLRKSGIKTGDRVLLFSPNDLFFPVVFMGIVMAGGIFTGANPTYTPRELAYQLKDSGAKYLLCAEENLDTGIAAAKSIGMGLDRVFLFNSAVFDGKGSGSRGCSYWGDLIASPAEGSRFVWESLSAPASALRRGIPVYIMARFDFIQMLENIQKFRINEILTVPSIMIALAKHPLVKKYDLSSLESIGSGAAPLGREISEEVESMFPPGKLNVRQGWGMTEATCTILCWDPNEQGTSSSVGELNANCECKIMAEDGVTELDENQRGEILVRAPNVMKGYWNKPEATRETLTEDGWLKTGDIGYVTEQGKFFIVDRKKAQLTPYFFLNMQELIKVKGNQVAPAELEGILLSHPSVADAAVVGITRDGEEYPRAYISLKAGAEATAKEITDYVKQNIAPTKRITGGVVFVKDIPKNPSGKILRKVLRERAAQELLDESLQVSAKL